MALGEHGKQVMNESPEGVRQHQLLNDIVGKNNIVSASTAQSMHDKPLPASNLMHHTWLTFKVV